MNRKLLQIFLGGSLLGRQVEGIFVAAVKLASNTTTPNQLRSKA